MNAPLPTLPILNILHIDCSPRAQSHSRALSAALLERLQAAHPGASIVRRDLGLAPIPHADAAYAAALTSPGAIADAQATGALQLSEQLIGEVEAADVVVIGTPMNNFTVPSVFKAWIDQLLRVGRTIGMSADGAKNGLLADKPVYIGVASGGVFAGEHVRQPDFLRPYLKAAFDCVGITKLQFFPLQATAFLPPAQLAANLAVLLDEMDLTLFQAAQRAA